MWDLPFLINADSLRENVTFHGYSIKDWESQFWANKLEFPSEKKIELYNAPIDTTFLHY